MRKDRDLDSWRIFCEVARTGSISASCDALGLDSPAISRSLHALEDALGQVPLFDRSTRPLRLTANGELAYDCAMRMLAEHERLIESLELDPLAMKGTIRVAFPPQLLQNFLLPFLTKFHDDFPEIYLEISESAGSTPVVFDTPKGRLDVICGYGADPGHTNIVQIAYGKTLQVPCASPIYLAKHGRPQTPWELADHVGILFESKLRAPIRTLHKDGVTAPLKWKHEITFDSPVTAVSATLCGAGIHPGIPLIHCYKAIAAGQLVPILTDWQSPGSDLYIYSRPEAVRHRRVQVLIERYRSFMDAIHAECEKALVPYLGEVHLGISR